MWPRPSRQSRKRWHVALQQWLTTPPTGLQRHGLQLPSWSEAQKSFVRHWTVPGLLVRQQQPTAMLPKCSRCVPTAIVRTSKCYVCVLVNNHVQPPCTFVGQQRALEEQLAGSQERQARLDWEHRQRSSQLAAELRAAREELDECRSVISAVQAQARAAAAASSVVNGHRYEGG